MKRPTKYRNVPTEVDGVVYASKKEARRAGELKFLERTGHVRDVELQPAYRLEVNGIKICDYRADFRYRDLIKDCDVVEDVKGYKTDVYKMKRRLMKAIHNIDVVET